MHSKLDFLNDPNCTIVIFDGVCNFCNAFVHFVIDADSTMRFRFVANQSEVGKLLLEHIEIPVSLDTIVLIESGNSYLYSTAVLRIFRQLDGLWKVLYFFIFIPQWFRDACYRWFAKNRYRWMGKTETCRIPTPELQQRFLTEL
jgi:predicted DCC family thiol-disulfide oxidoreductase YuxK